MKSRILLPVVALCTMLLSSCGAYKRLGLLQDMSVDSLYVVQDRMESRISVGDRLSITVTCGNPALAAPFNVFTGSQAYDSSTGEVDYTAGTELQQGYLVDKYGDIDFPVLGKINVAGTTLVEVKAEIEKRLKEKPYISDPLVFVEFTDFRITVLGQAKNGIYSFGSGSVNILEAIAKVDGPKTDAVLDDVWVIRTEGGARRLYSVNLKSTSLYDSPAFYLHQNDILYLKPKDSAQDSDRTSRQTIWNNMVTVISMLSSLVTVIIVYANR